MLAIGVHTTAAAETTSAYRLSYEEQEEGSELYETQYLVTDRYLRINDLTDKDGYILFDDTNKTIYSISHLDKSILVMKYTDYVLIDLESLVETRYEALPDAPKISEKPVFQYRVIARGAGREVCTDIQLAEGLLPEVTQILRHYMQVLASNQVSNLRRTPQEFQTACFVSDQVYNTGEYYNKGLPVLEWHSNHQKKALVNFEKVEVSDEVFTRPDNYREFTLEER